MVEEVAIPMVGLEVGQTGASFHILVTKSLIHNSIQASRVVTSV